MITTATFVEWWQFILVGLVFCVYSAYAINELILYKRLSRSGTVINAKIVKTGNDHWIIGSRALLCYVEYRFCYQLADDLDCHIRVQSITRAHYLRIKNDAEVKVTYLPDTPSISRLSGSDRDNTRLFVLCGGMLIALIVWISAAITLFSGR